jgi:hypothetical protein
LKSDRARQLRLKNFFNLTIEEWDLIEAYQGYCCAICLRKQKSGIRLATDHSHKFGTIRGLLDTSCNRILGKIERAWGKDINVIEALERLIDYLKNPPAAKALGKTVTTFPGRFGTKRHRKYLRDQKAKLNSAINNGTMG